MITRELGAGGTERVVSTLANYWSERGWVVTLITLHGVDSDFYDLNSSVKRIALNLDASGNSAFQRIFKYLLAVYRIRHRLLQFDPQVALAFMPASNVICGLACIGTHTIPIGSEHSHPPMAPLSRPWKMLCRFVYPRMAAVSALTQKSADWVRSRLGAKKVPVIANPIPWPLPGNNPKLSPSEILAPMSGTRLLLAVGRLWHEKGFDRLLDAFAELHAAHRDWRLVILGEGALRNDLERQRDELGLQNYVALPGIAGNISAWYEIADIYVLTSRYEGFGNTLAESLAYGVPAVAVDCETGPREILRHDVDGLLVPQGDPEALVGSLDRLMGDESLRIRFSERAVEARERFSVGRIASQWESIFKEFLDEKTRSGERVH